MFMTLCSQYMVTPLTQSVKEVFTLRKNVETLEKAV